MKLLIATIIVVTSACETPPPIKSGKCLVDTYRDERAVQQTCAYAGYTWSCVYQDEKNVCTRGAEISERAPAVSAPAQGGK